MGEERREKEKGDEGKFKAKGVKDWGGKIKLKKKFLLTMKIFC